MSNGSKNTKLAGAALRGYLNQNFPQLEKRDVDTRVEAFELWSMRIGSQQTLYNYLHITFAEFGESSGTHARVLASLLWNSQIAFPTGYDPDDEVTIPDMSLPKWINGDPDDDDDTGIHNKS